MSDTMSLPNREWKKCKLGDAITLQRGHDLPKSKMKSGNIPVAGSNGIIGYHNKATTKGPGITIGRSGNLGIAYFYKQDFWAHNTTLYVKDFKGNDELFIYYLLKNFNFKQYNVGSAVPTLNRNHIHPIDIIIPPLPEQKAIAAVLSSLDDKIDLLHRQNKTMEVLAE
ncbi:MAG: restriction endonuclease subunit S, partial [Calditrichaeota bacterium]|nr:restriction endonuclease subunit S [Calditrichota bacterium]